MSVKYIAVKFLAVSLPKLTAVLLLRLPFGGLRSETVIWIQKWFKKSVGTSRRP
jgi:hypothetical protein